MTLPILHLLLDADGNMMNWGGNWDTVLNTDYPQWMNLPRTADQRSFNLRLNLNEEESAVVDEIFNRPGFYRDLEPFEGAVEAYHKMVEAGHHVQFATSPWWSNSTCLQDKSESILEHFGEDAQKSLILTNDKTTIMADFLFDDKPEIKGHYEPIWSQILFDQPYNREIELPRITSWVGNQWEEVLEKELDKSYSLDVLY